MNGMSRLVESMEYVSKFVDLLEKIERELSDQDARIRALEDLRHSSGADMSEA